MFKKIVEFLKKNVFGANEKAVLRAEIRVKVGSLLKEGQDDPIGVANQLMNWLKYRMPKGTVTDVTLGYIGVEVMKFLQSRAGGRAQLADHICNFVFSHLGI